MLRDYDFNSNIGSGCLGLVDLYTRNNKKYVVKTQPLLVVESETNDLSRFDPEFNFARLIHLMPDNENKYFIKLLGSEVVTSIEFDTTKLCNILDPNPDENDIVIKLRKEHNTSTKYLRLLYPYAGITLFDIIVKMTDEHNINYKFMRKVVEDLIEIVAITRKYKWYIRDLHWGNVCHNGYNSILIDYGNIIDMHESQHDDIIANEFAVNSDYWKIIKIIANIEYYRGELKQQFTADDNFIVLLRNAIKNSSKHGLIKNYLDKFNGKLIDEFEYLNVLFCILDNKSYNEFWSSNWQYHVANVPLLLTYKDIIWLLNSYFC